MLEHRIGIRAAYRTTKVGAYLSLKAKVPKFFRADVVYEFSCPYDKDIRYIGEAQRQLFKRISDHVTTPSSAVYSHIKQCDECAKENNLCKQFSILRNCDKASVLSEEALCIKKFEPTLNVQMGPYKGARVATNIFN